MYILYRGDRIYASPDLVIKNNNQSFVDTIMLVGKPLEYLVTVKDFTNIKYYISQQNQFDENKNKYDEGILVIFYENNNKTSTILFKSNELEKLNTILEKNLPDSSRTKIIEWIKGVCRLHKKSI